MHLPKNTISSTTHIRVFDIHFLGAYGNSETQGRRDAQFCGPIRNHPPTTLITFALFIRLLPAGPTDAIISTVSIASDRECVVAGFLDGVICIWRYDYDKPILAVQGHLGTVSTIRW